MNSSSNSTDLILKELEKIEQLLEQDGVENFPEEVKRKFWRMVGKIKRQENPDFLTIEKAARIRERLHVHRFGKPIGTNELLVPFGIAAILLFLGSFIFARNEKELLIAGTITYIAYTLMFTIYFIILDFIIYDEFFTFFVILGVSVLELALLYTFLKAVLEFLVFYSALGVIPCLYPHGRWLAGKITKIELEGAIRDIYFLVTLKTDYKSYLRASPKQRHWFFFIAGSGTAVTSVILAIVEMILFSDYFFALFAITLIFGEALDYIYGGGKFAGEFGHARRERRIIKEIEELKTTKRIT
ncbi:MAG: hypothetical protein ACXAD7_10480 [Candidatus Kariarchaeaceae archaeon]